jgi:LysR family transcriptional regulator, regulator for metE and metH
MNIRHFQTIREIAQAGTLTQASEKLFLSQPAISHQLKEAENFFDTQLFIRQNKKMLLTKAGELVLSYGEEILGNVERLKKAIQQLNDQDSGEISVSTQCFTTYYWLAPFLKSFQEKYPRVEIKINVQASGDVVQSLISNTLDIGILDECENKKLQQIHLFDDEYVAVVPHSHPWSGMAYVNLSCFNGVPFIMHDIPVERSSMYKRLFAKTGNAPSKVYHVSLTEAIIEMVKADIGIAVLPKWVIRPFELEKHLCAIRITPRGLKRKWYTATLKNKELPGYISEFHLLLKKYIHANI